MSENAVILDMDESRELRWTFAAIKNFEKRGREILKRLDLKTERGQPIATSPMHAGFILSNFLRIAEVLEASVAAATGLSGLEGKKGEPSEASDTLVVVFVCISYTKTSRPTPIVYDDPFVSLGTRFDASESKAM